MNSMHLAGNGSAADMCRDYIVYLDDRFQAHNLDYTWSQACTQQADYIPAGYSGCGRDHMP